MNARKLFAVLTTLCLMMGVCVLAEENISDEAYVFSVDDVESVVSDAISDDTLISVEEVDQSYSDTSLDLGEEDAENGLDQDVSVTVIVEEGEGEETNPVVDMAVSEDSNENDTAEDGEETPSTLTDEAGVADGMIESITIEGETQVEDQDASAQTIPLFEGTVQGENHLIGTASPNAVNTDHIFGADNLCTLCQAAKVFDITTATITGINLAEPYSEKSFTGTDVDFDVSVKIPKQETLVRDRDYTVGYSGQINATADAHTLTITGVTPYTGTVNIPFYIRAVSLKEDGNPVTIAAIEPQTFTGAQIKPNVVLKIGDTVITNDKYDNYKVKYANNRDIGEKATLTVEPKEGESDGHKYVNFTDDRSLTFKILPASINDITVEGITEKNYTGSPQTQDNLVVKLKGNTLLKDSDYTVEYSNNTNAGTAKVIIRGGANLNNGTREFPFTINAASLSGASLTVDSQTQTYDGNEKRPGVTVTLDGKTLVSDTDYTVEYKDNTNAGTATVIVTGIGNYAGTLSGTFTINKGKRTVTVRYVGSVPDKVYDKSRNLPSGFTFRAKDFVYEGKADGDTVSIDQKKTDSSGKKIFSAGYDGVDVGAHKLNFKIAIKYNSTNCIYKLANDTITSEKSGNITPKKLTIRPGVMKKDENGNVVKDSNGKIVLESQTKVYGTSDPSSFSGVVDGIIEGDGEETDANGKIVSILGKIVTGKLAREKGEDVGKYKLSIGTIKVRSDTAEAKNYLNNPPDVEEGYFEILPKSISDFELDPIPDQQYTGSAVTPDKEIKLKYESKALGTKTLVKGTDFDVKYSNNVEPGTATVTITGKGNYTGTRTESFTILHKPSLLDKGIRISPIGSQKYTGSALEPVITVTYTKEGGDTQTLVEGTDYDVLYDNNIEIGIATVTLVGKGHFTGQRSIFFTIEKDGGSDPSSGAEDNPSSGTGDNPSSGTGDNTSSGSGNNSTSDTNDSSNTGSTSSVQSETTIDLVPNDPAPVPAPAPAAVVAQEPVTIAKVPASTKAKAGKKGKVTVSWKKIKKSKKTKALLNQIKSVQVQYSTDPNFAADVVTKTVSKKKTKLNLKLQKKTTYYIRVRYVGTDGVSDWGAVKKVTTKK